MYRPNCTCKTLNPEYRHQALASRRIHCQASQLTSESPLWTGWPMSSSSSTWGPETDMSRPGIEPGPPRWEVSTLAKSHYDIYIEKERKIVEFRPFPNSNTVKGSRPVQMVWFFLGTCFPYLAELKISQKYLLFFCHLENSSSFKYNVNVPYLSMYLCKS